MAFLLICAAWLFVAGYTSINAIVKAELFPTNVRAPRGSGPSLRDYGISVRRQPHLPWRCTSKVLGHEEWFYYYLSGMIFLSLIIYATMRDNQA